MKIQRHNQLERNGLTSLALTDAPVVAPVSLQDWADLITDASGQAVEKILAIGRILLAAKKAIKHGEWERMFKGHKNAIARPVRFSVTIAKEYMAVAKHPVLSNRNLSYDLPPSLGPLYQLSQLPESAITEFMASGVINPALKEEDAKKLRFPQPAQVEHIPDRPYATLAAFEAITAVNIPVLHGRTYRLCGRHRLVIASIVEPPHAWAALLDGTFAFFPWPDILVADHFGPDAIPVVFVQPDEAMASTILALYQHRYGVEAVELL